MAQKFKIIVRKIRIIIYLLFNLNIIKTIWINFKLLPFKEAIYFPIYVFGNVRLQLSGKIILNHPIKPGLLRIGYKFEMEKKEIGIAEFLLAGTFVVSGEVWLGMDTFLFVDKGAVLKMGDHSVLGCRCKLICTRDIRILNYVRIGYESVITDTSFHYTKDTSTNIVTDRSGSILLGNFNWIGGRSMIYKNTITPDYCIVSSNTLCNKDYKSFIPQYSMIGGLPAKLLKSNCVRIFDVEKEMQIYNYFERSKENNFLDN